MENRKLHKSSTDRIIFGVCGGIGERLGIDSTVIRIAFVVFCLLGGSGVLLYIASAVLMPSEAQINFERQRQFDDLRSRAYDTDYEVKD
ncbi:MAG: PspC domain-containing protein [Clostridiales bacterium]|nr:PspC domain-containing protein [Clostridiales bacterium]MDD6389820.1 PspC domain-containing protein [Bacillota bacterium]MDY5975195.1 PspC domain-containing protein [Anaerovoracaceae bacterium]